MTYNIMEVVKTSLLFLDEDYPSYFWTDEELINYLYDAIDDYAVLTEKFTTTAKPYAQTYFDEQATLSIVPIFYGQYFHEFAIEKNSILVDFPEPEDRVIRFISAFDLSSGNRLEIIDYNDLTERGGKDIIRSLFLLATYYPYSFSADETISLQDMLKTPTDKENVFKRDFKDDSFLQDIVPTRFIPSSLPYYDEFYGKMRDYRSGEYNFLIYNVDVNISRY